MWRGPERRSRTSRLARALVSMKWEADLVDAELDEAATELRAQERRLLEKLGGHG